MDGRIPSCTIMFMRAHACFDDFKCTRAPKPSSTGLLTGASDPRRSTSLAKGLGLVPLCVSVRARAETCPCFGKNSKAMRLMLNRMFRACSPSDTRQVHGSHVGGREQGREGSVASEDSEACQRGGNHRDIRLAAGGVDDVSSSSPSVGLHPYPCSCAA